MAVFTTIDQALVFLAHWHLGTRTIREMSLHDDQWIIDVANALRSDGQKEAYRQVLLG